MTVLRDELECPPERRRLGSGWLSGVAGLSLALLGLGAVLCLKYPWLLTMPDARPHYPVAAVRLAVQLVLAGGFACGLLSLTLRPQKWLGGLAVAAAMAATLLGGANAASAAGPDAWRWSLGLDWFLLNLTFTGLLFIPLEKLFGRRNDPLSTFRPEWREDLFYLLISSLLVQGLAYLSLSPVFWVRDHTGWTPFRSWIAAQPAVLQFLEIMFLTDLVQYWVHRAFHKFPRLWRFHAVHHSAETLDWLAGSRMHLMEVVVLRGLTVVPMYLLGFGEGPLYAYLFFVYLSSTLIHSNLRADRAWLRTPGMRRFWSLWERVLVTPRFHHWHHGRERAAIDKNFAVHFPVLDRLFGTHHLPAGTGPDDAGAWPKSTGVGGPDRPPKTFTGQFAYPFRRPPRPAAKTPT
ncbi:sterol desaturase family protein [Alienimonas californiensis]|uniref:Fatty acid hydroxylase superfamily protein n=1 Tax=Alienimonas californiensis TaxID=2527989 RepID=A0A517P644_9PLAN|nr:sterol desaturase family protein [Alienimonas californiensis]QDT14825.1 Fatty acid hydroxylase superfamily protein [Alienimonas californiensis]